MHILYPQRNEYLNAFQHRSVLRIEINTQVLPVGQALEGFMTGMFNYSAILRVRKLGDAQGHFLCWDIVTQVSVLVFQRHTNASLKYTNRSSFSVALQLFHECVHMLTHAGTVT